MTDKPSYLALLAATAVGENRTYRMMTAWRETTADTELAAVLEQVAAIEHEHSVAFSERLRELGFNPEKAPLEEYEEALTLTMARSAATDVEKFQRLLGYTPVAAAGPQADAFGTLFDDHTIDAATGALLGRFIAEERASERLLRAQLLRIVASSREAPSESEERRLLGDLTACVERLATILEDYRKIRP